MFVVVWEFRVRPGQEAEFEARYGPDGDWARLFRLGEGYGGTVLLRDPGSADTGAARASVQAWR